MSLRDTILSDISEDGICSYLDIQSYKARLYTHKYEHGDLIVVRFEFLPVDNPHYKRSWSGWASVTCIDETNLKNCIDRNIDLLQLEYDLGIPYSHTLSRVILKSMSDNDQSSLFRSLFRHLGISDDISSLLT